MTMNSFNVLDRKTSFDRDLILEASAGTGKTYSIENIVVRLLIGSKETPPQPLEKMLVVTFTRAATRDLLRRVRGAIEGAIDHLTSSSESMPDYLKEVEENGAMEVRLAIQNLEQALLIFDEAPIMTIHSFCSNLLRENVIESDLRVDALAEAAPISRKQLIRVIRDVFRTELQSDKYSPAQIAQLLQGYGESVERLEKELVRTLIKGYPIKKIPDFQELVPSFALSMHLLKEKFHLNGSKLLAAVEACIPHYNGIKNRQKEIKEEVLTHLDFLVKLLDQSDWTSEDLNRLVKDQLLLCEYFDTKMLSLKSSKLDEHSRPTTDWRNLLEQHLRPFVSSIRIFTKLASDCQILLERRMSEQEILSYDDLLKIAYKSLEKSAFCIHLQNRYGAVIVDEFQDTDPLQWGILKRAFHGKVPLYLVGDPKQSIYAFRQADIYTYMDAYQQIPQDQRMTLDVNYRSTPQLVEALNALFTKASPFLNLPRTNTALPFRPVSNGRSNLSIDLQDNKGAVHFLVATFQGTGRFPPLDQVEEKVFFPVMIEEIKRVENFNFSVAILVSDRYQGHRVVQTLKRWGISSLSQRAESLLDSEALPLLKELLSVVLNPKAISELKTLLCSRLFCWTAEQLICLDREELLDSVLFYFENLKKVLLEEGFSQFFEVFSQSQVGSYTTPLIHRLLSQEEGEEFWSEWLQLAQLLMQEEAEKRRSPEGLIQFLSQLEMEREEGDERYLKRENPDLKGVHVMTLHSSKGLEFDVVFPLGLLKKSPLPSLLVPCEGVLSPVENKEDPRYIAFCEEIDAEKMRQLYVAFTRARERLYIPCLDLDYKTRPGVGVGAPLELFLHRICQNESLLDWISHSSPSISYEILTERSPIPLCQAKVSEPPLLSPPPQVQVSGEPQIIHSFTSLSKTLPDKGVHSSSLPIPPHDFHSEIKTAHTLPAGSQTGTILHEILEKIPHPDAILRTVEDHLKGSNFAPWSPVFTEMIRRAFSVELDGFTLSDVKPLDMYKENEFLYNGEKHLLQGVIDLIFMYDEKFYLLDWKSNWLGNNSACYCEEQLMNTIKEHHYDLQARIYEEAFKRYLSLIIDKPFEDIFGGTFYVFLRGLEENQRSGICLLKSQFGDEKWD